VKIRVGVRKCKKRRIGLRIWQIDVTSTCILRHTL
jgi:hypothetical protein